MSRNRRLKRIHWDIIGRLVVVIRNNPGMKKTQIAMKSCLSYDKCGLYLEWMETMDLVKRELDEKGFQLIRLTERGNELYLTEFELTEEPEIVLVT
ncbi:MAG: winged helix-turn-helix domain-containing protein [Nitrososphaera sp.]